MLWKTLLHPFAESEMRRFLRSPRQLRVLIWEFHSTTSHEAWKPKRYLSTMRVFHTWIQIYAVQDLDSG